MSLRLHSLTVVAVAACLVAGAALVPSSASAAFTYLATRNLVPGPVLQITSTGTEGLTYIRPSNNNLTSFAIGPSVEPLVTTAAVAAIRPTRLYYCNAVNQRSIFRAGDVPIFTGNNYIREVAFGPGPALYFSEASGAGGDGKIYKLSPTLTPVLFYTVRLAQVGGFWAGHFAFNPEGKLFIANGNTGSAKVWHCPIAAGAAPTSVYASSGPILGFCFVAPDRFLYTDGSPLLRLTTLGATTASVQYTSPRQNKYCDVLSSDIQYNPQVK